MLAVSHHQQDSSLTAIFFITEGMPGQLIRRSKKKFKRILVSYIFLSTEKVKQFFYKIFGKSNWAFINNF